MTFWKKYVATVSDNCLQPYDAPSGNLLFWRDRLFVQIITWLLPISSLAVIVGIVLSVRSELYHLAIIDFYAFLSMAFICFNRTLSMQLRKTLFIAVIYVLAIALFSYLGSAGAGILYFLAGTFFTVLVFPGNTGYWSVVANAIVCVYYSFAFYRTAPANGSYTLSSWVAISANLVILSLAIVLLMQRLFHSLGQSINAIELQNARLREIAWIQSHKVRSPVATILGLAPLLDPTESRSPENKEIIEGIVQSCEHLDVIIKEITDLTSEMERE